MTERDDGKEEFDRLCKDADELYQVGKKKESWPLLLGLVLAVITLIIWLFI